jgi:DNA polymerase III subunit epsilon
VGRNIRWKLIKPITNQEKMNVEKIDKFDEQWAIVELDNGEQFRGKVSEKTEGIPMLKVDVPAREGGKAYTTFIAPGAIRSVELITPDEAAENVGKTYAGLKVHTISCVECYKSGSGNVTWKAYDEDQAIIYLRQAHREMLTEAGLWDQLNQMEIGDEWDAEIFIHTIPDGDFLKPIEFGEGGKVIRPASAAVDGGTLPDDAPGIPEHTAEVINVTKVLLEEPFVVIDWETTGVDVDAEIVQIGIINHLGVTVFHSLVKPTQPILNSHIHGITNAMVQDAPTFPEVYEQVKAALGDKIVAAYNVEFEKRILRQVCERHELEPITFKAAYCAMLWFAQWRGEWNFSRNGWAWAKLHEALNAFGLKHDDFGGKAHSAIGDAAATLGLIRAMAGQKTKADMPFSSNRII